MGITTPPQAIPSLPERADLDTQIWNNGLFASSGTSPLWATGTSNTSYGQQDTQLGCITSLSNVTAAGVAVNVQPFVCAWFETVDIEWYWYLPTPFGDGAASAYSAGLTSVSGGSPCSSGRLMQIQFASGGTLCTGTLQSGFWAVFTGRVSNNTRFVTTTPFTLGTWNKCNIIYNKNPKTLDYYVNDVPIVSQITNINLIPDEDALNFGLSYSGALTNTASMMLIDYVKITTTSATRELP